MEDFFQSSVVFDSNQLETMVTEIGDILRRLRDRDIIDYASDNAIELLNGSRIEFKKTEDMEIKRFIALVDRTVNLLSYLTRNLSFSTMVTDVERDDRIMGSINVAKTQNSLSKFLQKRVVICNEISRTMITPENLILAQILFCIAIQCNRYLSKRGVLDSGIVLNISTVRNLKLIRDQITNLLSAKSIRDLLPKALDNQSIFESLFNSMVSRINLGKVPRYYSGIYKLLYKWKYYIWTSSSNQSLEERSMRYHFYYLKERHNQLYECWVFYKVLDLISYLLNWKLKEAGGSEGQISFRSSDRAVTVTYQRIYNTAWKKTKQERFIQDRPDIVIEFKNGKIIVLDAKNSDLSHGTPYREQIESYMRSAGNENTDFGILLFSKGEQKDWDEAVNGYQNIYWRTLTPGNESLNSSTIDEVVRIVKNYTGRKSVKSEN